ncbi:MAG: COX15/CtaA family protein [Verrucomicrobiota bacterium]
MLSSFYRSLRTRHADFKPGLFAFSCFAAAWSVLLLYAGGFTTSIQAGMAFLDWPLSNGSINPDGWLSESDKLAEHSHRLMGANLGFLAIISAIWHFFREERKRVRLLSYALFWLVVSQGLLGGLRVLLDQLNTGFDSNVVAQSFAVAHACGAQFVFCSLIAIAVLHSPFWLKGELAEAIDYGKARIWGWCAVITLFLQILVGAVMRHSHAGLAIPTFPLASEDSLLPPFWSFPISIHFAHRVGAVIASVALIGFVVQVFKNQDLRARLGGNAVAVIGILIAQIYLGALTIWTVKNPHAATMHMLVGAFLMGSTWMLVFRLYRYKLAFSSSEVARQSVGLTPSSASSESASI